MPPWTGLYEGDAKRDAACVGHISLGLLFFGRKILFAYATEFAGEVGGEVFPLDAGFFLVVNPAANIADILHFNVLLILKNQK